MKRIKIKLIGGYHNRDEMIMFIDYRAIGYVGDVDLTYLSRDQKRRADKHFCGIKGCSCGGYSRVHTFICSDKIREKYEKNNL